MADTPTSTGIRHDDWRERWKFKTCVDESYPLAVRMAGAGEFLVGFSTGGGDPEEAEELGAALASELAESQLSVTTYSDYEVGRGASAEILLFALGAPLLWSLKTMGELALTDPEKLKENLQFWQREWRSLRTRFERLGVSQLGDEVLTRAALAEFSADFPDRVPDVQRVTIIRHIGDVPEAGWVNLAETTVLIPDALCSGHAIYVMNELGCVRRRLDTFANEASQSLRDYVEGVPLLTSALVSQDDPALGGADDERADNERADDERGQAPAVRVEVKDE